MNEQDIHKQIKRRGYTLTKISEMINYSLPTLRKLIRTKPFIIHYVIEGLPEVSHIKKERTDYIRPSK